ncbi:B_lectin domain-containing protein, partial [Cephalotus follicularis]
VDSVTRLHETRFLLFTILYASTWLPTEATTTTSTTSTQQLLIGFKATPNPTVSSFQSLLTDPTGNFSLGFFRVNSTQLALVVLHVPSTEPLWLANPTNLATWSDRTQLIFNGSLVISDPQTRVFWSTGTEGDKVVLLANSNLQVVKLVSLFSVRWQSFDFPYNTLVENQNFTSTMSLVSSNGLYNMLLGSDFMGLYAAFKDKADRQIYWKHGALEAKAQVVVGQGPIHAQVNSNGYLGMYQNSNKPVDVQPFNSFQRPITGLLTVRLEPDGNLKGYYWDGSNWILDYQAISDTCELPSPCGSYGLCIPGSGCSCLDNRTEFQSGSCFASSSGDFCSEEDVESEYWVLTRKGVELPFKELMRYEMASSLELCEGFCAKNCSCWGTVYNNASGFCYIVDYPIQTLVGVGDDSKVGYFKVRKGSGKKRVDVGFRIGIGIGIGLLCGAIVILIGVVGFTSRRIWRRQRGVNGFLEEDCGASPGPYKDLGSASFKSIEI